MIIGEEMFFKIVLLFVLVPIVEIVLLFDIGSAIGLNATLLIILLTGFLGAWISRMQGMIVLRQIQTEISQGVMPDAELIGGAIVFAGGILLLTPGIATDVVGFAVMVPFLRHKFQGWILRKFQDAVERGTFKIIS